MKNNKKKELRDIHQLNSLIRLFKLNSILADNRNFVKFKRYNYGF